MEEEITGAGSTPAMDHLVTCHPGSALDGAMDGAHAGVYTALTPKQHQ